MNALAFEMRSRITSPEVGPAMDVFIIVGAVGTFCAQRSPIKDTEKEVARQNLLTFNGI